MNRKLLALAIGAALALPMAAQAAPSVYGQLNMSLDKVDIDDDPTTLVLDEVDQLEVSSNSSRIGVKGEEDLGNGLSAVYKAEWGVSGDTAGPAGTDLNGRDRFLGLKGAFGTVKMGAFDSPLKDSQGNVDQFDDMNRLDMGNFIWGENRMDNLLGYESPKIADAITISVAAQAGETTANDSIGEALSASVAYEANGLYAALAMDTDVSGGGYSTTAGRDAMRLTVTYTMDALQIGGMFQTSETSDTTVIGSPGQDDEEVFLLSAAYSMGKNTFKGQFIMANDDFGAGAETDQQVIELGYDHNFTQMTKAFAQYGMINVDMGAGVDMDASVFSLGMQTKF